MDFLKNLKKLMRNICPYGIVVIYYSRSKKRNRNAAVEIKTINYQVNNFCNSKCVMCGIWRQNDFEYLSLDDFKKIMRDPLFASVNAIGITGGEPSLVENLPDYFQAAIDTLPSLTGLSMISNSILTERLKKLIMGIRDRCGNAGKYFSVMLSLDGVGPIHDRNRSVPGNFIKTSHLIDWLKENQIPFQVGVTITKENVWHLDELYAYFKERQIYARFRIAEFIDRLCNNSDENKYEIRNFDHDEIYQLLLFFSKLEYNFENDEIIKNTYRSIQHMLQGGRRLIECPYKNMQAVNVSSHGELAYCAPKSPILGNLLKDSGIELYHSNLTKLDEIKTQHCENCIHDYHAEPTAELQERLETTGRYREYLSTAGYLLHRDDPVHVVHKCAGADQYTVLITGWYGTETTGDKAILAGIIDQYTNKQPQIMFYISSLYPFVTERTLRELSLNAVVVPVYGPEFLEVAAAVDEVVVGGGPLMEIEELSILQWAFALAKRHHHRTTVYGCGIGPLYSEEKKAAVAEILDMADKVYLRDTASVQYAQEVLQTQKKCIKIDDPAVAYINKLIPNITPSKELNKLSCFLRELPYDYCKTLSYEEYLGYKELFYKRLADNIKYLCDKECMTPHLYAMQNFCLGADDRDFNYYFAQRYLTTDAYVDNKLSTVQSILEQIGSAHFNLSMRYHSVVFAENSNASYAAIDYTSGGKISGYLNDVGKSALLITPDDIINDDACIHRLYANHLLQRVK